MGYIVHAIHGQPLSYWLTYDDAKTHRDLLESEQVSSYNDGTDKSYRVSSWSEFEEVLNAHGRSHHFIEYFVRGNCGVFPYITNHMKPRPQ